MIFAPVTPIDQATTSAPAISVVSPVYRAEKMIEQLVGRVSTALAAITNRFEIILVDDSSPDTSWAKIVELAEKNPTLRGIRLSRNFGQHYAISAGLQMVRGDWIIVMDCDLQDVPEEIPNLFRAAQEGFDIVLARRVERNDSFGKRIFSRMFYAALSYLSGAPQDPTVANFGVYRRCVIDAINNMPESIRYFPTMVQWVGFRSRSIPVKHAPRAEGHSTYNFNRLLRLALDIILAYSDKPLTLAVKAGFLISFAGFVFAAITVIQAVRGEIKVLGYASLVVSIWVLAGLTIMIVGIVGLYVGKIFQGVKRRPSFIVRENTSHE